MWKINPEALFDIQSYLEEQNINKDIFVHYDYCMTWKTVSIIYKNYLVYKAYKGHNSNYKWECFWLTENERVKTLIFNFINLILEGKK